MTDISSIISPHEILRRIRLEVFDCNMSVFSGKIVESIIFLIDNKLKKYESILSIIQNMNTKSNENINIFDSCTQIKESKFLYRILDDLIKLEKKIKIEAEECLLNQTQLKELIHSIKATNFRDDKFKSGFSKENIKQIEIGNTSDFDKYICFGLSTLFLLDISKLKELDKLLLSIASSCVSGDRFMTLQTVLADYTRDVITMFSNISNADNHLKIYLHIQRSLDTVKEAIDSADEKELAEIEKQTLYACFEDIAWKSILSCPPLHKAQGRINLDSEAFLKFILQNGNTIYTQIWEDYCFGTNMGILANPNQSPVRNMIRYRLLKWLTLINESMLLEGKLEVSLLIKVLEHDYEQNVYISPKADIGSECIIYGKYITIDESTKIRERCVIKGSNILIGENAVVGAGCYIESEDNAKYFIKDDDIKIKIIDSHLLEKTKIIGAFSVERSSISI